MKNYTTPDFEILKYEAQDIITTSPGAETPALGEGGGSWDW